MKLEIKKVNIGKLKLIKKTGIIQSKYTVTEYERKIIDDKICIIDDCTAVDINNFNNKYKIITKESQLLPISSFNEEEDYVLSTESIKPNIKQKILMNKYKKYKKIW